MDEWWRLTRRYPAFRRITPTTLKDFGYLKLFDLLDEAPRARVLEFGHGFNAAALERFQDTHDMHGLDDFQEKPYFPTARDDWDAAYERDIAGPCPRATLRRGLLGQPLDLPEASFDVIASVSVLEEVTPEAQATIIDHAATLLAPGGRFVGTIDVALRRPEPVATLIAAIQHAGLELDAAAPTSEDLVERFNTLILEDPCVVMTAYQITQGEDRRYFGQVGTAWFVATKPA